MKNLSDNFTFDLGWGNTHEDWGGVLLPRNVIQYEDRIEILTKRELVTGWRCLGDDIIHLTKEFSTGHLISKDQWLYGQFECEVTIPLFRGNWPAFWLYPMQRDEALPAPVVGEYNEIDWFEKFIKNWLAKYRIQGNIHKDGRMTPKTKYMCHPSARFNVKGKWKSDYVGMWLNGKKYYEVTGKENISQVPMNLLIGGGVGNWDPDLRDEAIMTIHTLKVNGKDLI